MFSFLGKHPSLPFSQFVLNMLFLRLASLSLDMPYGHDLLLLKGCPVSAMRAHTGGATASAPIPQRDNEKSDTFAMGKVTHSQWEK